MPVGRYFYIRSEMNDFVLDVKGGSHEPGTLVITWPQKDGDSANQLWYVDRLTHTIRSKMHHFCLDINDDNRLITKKYDSDREQQKWKIDGDTVKSREDDDNRVLDVAAAQMDPGAEICAWHYHGNDNQKWSFNHVEAEYFYIHSKMHGKVLDIKHHDPEAGKKVVMFEKEDGQDSQLWYFNKDGYLCNKLNDYVIDTSDGNKARLQPYEKGSCQCWVPHGDRICLACDKDQVLDIKGGAAKDGAKLLVFNWHGGDNQRWEIKHD